MALRLFPLEGMVGLEGGAVETVVTGGGAFVGGWHLIGGQCDMPSVQLFCRTESNKNFRRHKYFQWHT